MFNPSIFRMKFFSNNIECLNLFFDVLKYRDMTNHIPSKLIEIDQQGICCNCDSDGVWSARIEGEISGNFSGILNNHIESYCFSEMFEIIKDKSPDSLDKICQDLNVGVEVYWEYIGHDFQGHIVIDNLGKVLLNENASIETRGFQKPWKKSKDFFKMS